MLSCRSSVVVRAGLVVLFWMCVAELGGMLRLIKSAPSLRYYIMYCLYRVVMWYVVGWRPLSHVIRGKHSLCAVLPCTVPPLRRAYDIWYMIASRLLPPPPPTRCWMIHGMLTYADPSLFYCGLPVDIQLPLRTLFGCVYSSKYFCYDTYIWYVYVLYPAVVYTSRFLYPWNIYKRYIY